MLAEDDESVEHYGRQLISWFKSIRGHLIEILSRTTFILKEKEERKKKLKEESKVVQEVLDQMAMLQTYVMKTDSKLNEVAQRQNLTTSGKNKTIPKPPGTMDVDDPPAHLQDDFTVLLEDVRHYFVPHSLCRGTNFSISTDKNQSTRIPCLTTDLHS